MNVEIVDFPETKIAVIEHQGPPELEIESIKQLIAWRIENRLPPSDKHRNYGLYYNDLRTVEPDAFRMDIALSIEQDVAPNSHGVVTKTIPALRCARVRHLGSRDDVPEAGYLYDTWLPNSREMLADFPVIFHYVNVGPDVTEADMITDVYLPLK